MQTEVKNSEDKNSGSRALGFEVDHLTAWQHIWSCRGLSRWQWVLRVCSTEQLQEDKRSTYSNLSKRTTARILKAGYS